MRKKFGLVCTLIIILLFSGCVQTLSSSSEITSSSGSSSISEISNSSAAVSKTPNSSTNVSEPSTSSDYWEMWEEKYDPNDWTTTKYNNVDVNGDLSVFEGKTIAQIVTGNCITCVLTTTGELYTIGVNQHKQLGKNTFQYLYGLQKVDIAEPIKLVAVGLDGCVAVGESNTIYIWGLFTYRTYSDKDGTTLIDARGNNIMAIPFDQEITQIKFQISKITFLTASGDAYALGEPYMPVNDKIDGYECTDENVLTPQKIELPEKIVQVDTTEAAMFWLGESGKVYLAYNRFIVDFPTKEIDCNPYARVLDFDLPVAEITAGLNMLFMRRTDGTVWAAGVNYPEMLSIKEKMEENSLPNYDYWVLEHVAQVQLTQKVRQVYTSPGRGIVYYFTENQEVYAAGEYYNDWFLQGDQDSLENSLEWKLCSTPQKMQLPKLSEFYANGITYYFRDAADKKIYTAGHNLYGTALGAKRALDSAQYMQRIPVEVPLSFAEDFTLS